MRLTSYINNQKCLEWGLNLQQGALFDLLYQASSWAESVYIDGSVFYWLSKNKICEELPVAYSKPDTAYRALKLLADKGLILYVKHGAKDCIALTMTGKTWNSEINPSLGKKSEQTRKNIREASEKNPTYKTTIDNSTSNNKNTNARDSKKLSQQTDNQEKSENTEMQQHQKKPTNGYSEAFEEWWSIYPKKVGKGDAWKSWKRDKLDKKADQLIEKLEAQNAMQYSFTEYKFIPLPATYLNQSRYDDDVQLVTNGGINETNPSRKLSAVERVRIANEKARAERAAQNTGT